LMRLRSQFFLSFKTIFRSWGGITVTDNPTKLRQKVHQILNDESKTDDVLEKRRLVEIAFDLAQQAEAINRLHEKAATDSKVQGLVEQLYADRDCKQRETHRELLICEERMYGLRQERLELLERLLHDCDGRVLRLQRLHGQHRINGALTQGEESLLQNAFDVQQLLRNLLRKESAN